MHPSFMAYRQQSVSLDLDTDVTHQCALHYTRDQHLIGIIEFSKPGYLLRWQDLEYFRRRTEEMSVMPFPDCINAMIIDVRNVTAWLDNDVPIIPWRLLEEECPVRLVVPAERIEHYAGFFEPTWLTTDVDTAIQEIREFIDMFVHLVLKSRKPPNWRFFYARKPVYFSEGGGKVLTSNSLLQYFLHHDGSCSDLEL